MPRLKYISRKLVQLCVGFYHVPVTVFRLPQDAVGLSSCSVSLWYFLVVLDPCDVALIAFLLW